MLGNCTGMHRERLEPRHMDTVTANSGKGLVHGSRVFLIHNSTHYLQVQVQDVHLVHVVDSLTDLLHKDHGVHLCQVVVIINNPLKELSTVHTAGSQGREVRRG